MFIYCSVFSVCLKFLLWKSHKYSLSTVSLFFFLCVFFTLGSSLDPHLQEALKDYLVARGIRESLTNFLLVHLHRKEQDQYVNWLKMLESSVAKAEWWIIAIATEMLKVIHASVLYHQSRLFFCRKKLQVNFTNHIDNNIFTLFFLINSS